ncbi:hypothetical protein [Argonema galeatum]|uniref:hypothetical protein n=1 Tax=Argonema galeatum TaxID=2942762 RepID=UPI002012911C|nr:hypothetical protein [Argonema galeatum]MCL1466041.1 hypothetical protein [Argonema galeatum A003/A1]
MSGEILGDLLGEIQGLTAPIMPLTLTIESQNFTIQATSDTEVNGFQAGMVKIFSLFEHGKLLLEEFALPLNQYREVSVASPTTSVDIEISPPYWIEQIKIRAWETLNLLQATETQTIPQPPISTPASLVQVQVAPALKNRSRLNICNLSNSKMLIRYGGNGISEQVFDELILPYWNFQYTENVPPEESIDALWILEEETEIEGYCVISQCTRSLLVVN